MRRRETQTPPPPTPLTESQTVHHTAPAPHVWERLRFRTPFGYPLHRGKCRVSVIDFWTTIHETGHLLVAPPGKSAVDASDDQALGEAIARTEAYWRTDLAFDPPRLIIPVAAWAVQTMFRASQCMVYREIDPDMVRAALAVACPQMPPDPDICYSADLGLRVLPDVLTLARAGAPDDPLVHGLREIAARWPLSSVGVQPPMEEPLDLSPFIDHQSLRRLYADRIIARGDTSRLSDDRVRSEVRAALGAYAQELASATVVSAAYGENERE